MFPTRLLVNPQKKRLGRDADASAAMRRGMLLWAFYCVIADLLRNLDEVGRNKRK